MREKIRERIEMIRQGKIPNGYKRSEIGIIPKKWCVKSVSDVAEVKGGKRIPKGYNLTEKVTRQPYITVSDMSNGKIDLNNIKYVPEEVIEQIKNYRIYKGEIFISVAGSLGLVGFVPSELDGANLTENANKLTNIRICPEFLKYVLESPIIQKEIKKEQTKNAQPKLALGRIKKLKFAVGSEKEVREISKILLTWDKGIDFKEKLIEYKKEQKKGLMNNLLTGKIRLSNFSGKWEKVRLGNISTIVTGTTPPTKRQEFYGQNYPWVTPTDIQEEKYISNSERFLSESGLKKGRFIPKGSLLVTCIASIGKNAILKADGSCNQQINAILPSCNHSNEFLYYYLCFKKSYLEKLSGKSATPILNKKTFSNISFEIPKLEEQKAISKILSTIDEEIELQKKELEYLKEQKKGLMQLLLTGKVRVKC